MSLTPSPLRRVCVTALAALATTVLGAAVPASAAEPGAPVPLRATKLTDVRDMVQAKGHLFVSTGQEVRVLDTHGKLRKRIKHLPGASGLVASPGGDRVYVAVRDSGSVVSIDTRRLKVVHTFRVGPCPTDVALTGGRLFFATASCGGSEASIASVDPARGGAPSPSGAVGVPEPVLLVGAGSTLVMADAFGSPSVVTSFAVSGPALARQATEVEDGILTDLAVSPDGATVYVPRTSSSGARAFPTSTLRDPVSYATGGAARSLAAGPDGRTLSVGVHETGPDLLVFRVGSASPVLAGSTVWSGAGRPESISGTLTYADDGSRAFELLAGPYPGDRVYLASVRT